MSNPVLKKLYLINRLLLKSASKEKRNRLSDSYFGSLKRSGSMSGWCVRELANKIPRASYYKFDG